MTWYDVRLPDDTDAWRAHCESARKDADELRRLADAIRAKLLKQFPNVAEKL